MPDAPVHVDLDLEAERVSTFGLRGEVFHIRQLSYAAFARADAEFMARLAALNEADEAAEAEAKARADEAKERGEEADENDVDISQQTDRWIEQLDAFADFIEVNIAEADLPRWRDLRNREENGIQQRDVQTLRRWLWEAQTGRPLTSGSASSNGQLSSEASLKDESGSPAVVRPS